MQGSTETQLSREKKKIKKYISQLNEAKSQRFLKETVLSGVLSRFAELQCCASFCSLTQARTQNCRKMQHFPQFWTPYGRTMLAYTLFDIPLHGMEQSLPRGTWKSCPRWHSRAAPLVRAHKGEGETARRFLGQDVQQEELPACVTAAQPCGAGWVWGLLLSPPELQFEVNP